MRLAVFIGLCLVTGCGDSTGATEGAGGGGVGGRGEPSGLGGAGGIDLNVWPCTEQGIRDAVIIGGGPHTFACDGPAVVTTEATIDIENDVILDGEGNLTVDGDDDHTVFNALHAGRVVLRNMTIQRGYTEGAGAGIRNSESDLFVEGCNIIDNESSEQIGGGIYSFGGVLEIVGSTISRNEARIGGGLACLGDDLTIRDSFITDNVGGGIDNRGGELFVADTTLEGNTAEEGGGIYAYDASRFAGDLWLYELGQVDLAYSTISNNTAKRGAGVYSISLRTSVWNGTLSGNAASEQGGALYLGGTTLGAC